LETALRPSVLFYKADAGFRDPVGDHQVADALSTFPVTEQSNATDLQRSPANLAAFETGVPPVSIGSRKLTNPT
jgi:hypothetical protein